MQWQFRKILESIESYRQKSSKFIGQIQRGNPSVLRTIVREIQLIISDPVSNILSKVLAMRFARDIMILGRQDVINQMAKLVPHILKVCSYRMQSDDPNRGETFFYDHPQYKNASPAQKQQIQRYGSTYFILNLQSIYHWGTWIKQDESGNQSIYSKGLNNLIQRGVKFHNNFNYYKNSDTQKFKNVYKVQFFPEESASDLDSNFQSQFSKSQTGSQVFNKNKQVNSVAQLINALQGLKSEGGRRFDRIQQFNKCAINLLQQEQRKKGVSLTKNQKSNKIWLQKFILNYNLLNQHKISYDEFMKRSTAELIQIDDQQQINIGAKEDGFRKQKTSAKRQFVGKALNDEKSTYQQLMKKQNESYQSLKQKFKYEIGELNNRLSEQRAQFQTQRKQLAQNYEERIRNMKMEIGMSNSNRHQIIIKQNEKLKSKLSGLEKSLQASRSREVENDNILAAYDMLKVEHENLKRQKIDDAVGLNERRSMMEKIKVLQKELNNQRSNSQLLLNKLPNQDQLMKKNKQIQNLTDELNIYKGLIKAERQQNQRKTKLLQQKIETIEGQLKITKEKNRMLQKKIDLRDIEAVELEQQVKLFKTIDKPALQSHRDNFHIIKQSRNRDPSQSIKLSQRKTNQKRLHSKQDMVYNFKKFQPLRNTVFKDQKQLYLRFCRCCLKKKDLLLKDNGLQIGLISQPLSNNQVKFIIHLTNTSQYQLNQIKIHCEASSQGENQFGLETQNIFCLQPNQQQKVNLYCKSINYFMSQVHNPAYLVFNYIKNDKVYQTKVVIPFMLFKVIQVYNVDRSLQSNPNNQCALTFNYSTKMIPNEKYLFSYLPGLQKIAENRYECDLLNRQTNSRFRLSIYLKEDNKITIVLSLLEKSSMPSRQQNIIEQDLMGFFQFCFRK